jgi:hypothetical protein
MLSPMHAICTTHLILLDFITLHLKSTNCEVPNCFPVQCSSSSYTSTFPHSSILLRILFLDIWNLQSVPETPYLYLVVNPVICVNTVMVDTELAELDVSLDSS